MINPGKLWYIFIDICLFGKTTMQPLSNYELSNPRKYKQLLRIVVMKIKVYAVKKWKKRPYFWKYHILH